MILLTILLLSGRISSVITGKESGNAGRDPNGERDGVSNGGPSAAAINPNRANIEVVLYESDFNGDYSTRTYQLIGEYSPSGAKISAEGEILQVGYDN